MVTIVAFYLSFFSITSFATTSDNVVDTPYTIHAEAPAHDDVFGKGAKRKVVTEDVDGM
jgi:hypothetical protein